MPDTNTIGDRYKHAGGLRLVYRVIQIKKIDHHPDHVTLVSENLDRRTITIGAGELQNRQQWERVLPV